MGRFGLTEIVHRDRGKAFHYELLSKLLRMSGTEPSLTTAYSSEENGTLYDSSEQELLNLYFNSYVNLISIDEKNNVENRFNHNKALASQSVFPQGHIIACVNIFVNG